MHTEVEPPPAPSTRAWRRAFGDIAAGFRQRELWGHLGMQDIKQGYRRSVLGPLWITLGLGMTAVAMGILYSALFQQPLEVHLPYLTIGLVIWQLIVGCVNEGASVFIKNEGLIKHLPAPLTVHILRLNWRQVLLFGHNAIVMVVVLLVFPQPMNLGAFLVIPAFALLVLNGLWASTLIGIVATRFRDIPPITATIMNLLFFLSPIVWNYEILIEQGPPVSERARWAEFNPFFHYIEMFRRPLVGDAPEPRNWIVVGAITVVGWALALLFLRNYRARVSYWV